MDTRRFERITQCQALVSKRLWVLTCVIVLIVPVIVFSQDVTLKKLRVVVVPHDPRKEQSRSDRAIDVVIQTMNRLGRFEVVDRRTTEATLHEMILDQAGLIEDSQVIRLGKLLGSRLGVIVTLHDWQVDKIHVQKEKKKVVKRKRSRVETTTSSENDVDSAYISIGLKQIEIETGKTLQAFTVNSGHGEQAGASSAANATSRALASIRRNLFKRLGELYPLLLQVVEKRAKSVTLRGDHNLGLKEDTIFEIFPPETIETIGGREIHHDGRTTGFGQSDIHQ